MKAITISIGADHRGYAFKKALCKQTIVSGYFVTWNDVGCFSAQRTDYPRYAQLVAATLCDGEAKLGILLCGSGAGMAIVANRHAGIYAGVAWNEAVAKSIRADDHVNILVIPADFVTQKEMHAMVAIWLKTACKRDRYQKRIAMIDKISK